jgi:hypothetical protein
MAKKVSTAEELKIERPLKAKLTVKESLKRMAEFSKRKKRFVATVREDKN